MTDQTDLDLPEVAPDESDASEKTFDAEYVTKLRSEAAEARTKAKESATRGDVLYEQLLARTREQATAGILHSPDDLPAEGDYLDDSGMPSLDKIRAAAEALAQAKPYLSVPHGDIAQGARESEAQVSFGDLIRGALR